MPDDRVQFHFSEPEESNGFLLWQLTMQWQRLINRELDKLDLTHVQFVLLAALGWLSARQETVTQVDMANHSRIDRMMTSKVLRTLQEKGFVTRQEHQTDTRAKSIRLTESGQAILQQAVRTVERVDRDFFAVLGPKEKALNGLMRELLA